MFNVVFPAHFIIHVNSKKFNVRYRCNLLNKLSTMPWRRMDDPRFLDLGTSWRWVVSFTPRLLYPQWKSPQYPLHRRLCGPQSRSGWHGEVKSLAPTRIRTLTPWSSSPLPAAILTELSWLSLKHSFLWICLVSILQYGYNFLQTDLHTETQPTSKTQRESQLQTADNIQGNLYIMIQNHVTDL
jgi:hypothetical protein